MSLIGPRCFRLVNKLFMVPMFRLGFGPLLGNRLTGYIMVLKTIGRKTGKIRYAPVNYAIHQGNVYCMVGWGRLTDWYQNLIATREIEVILPGGSLFGTVVDVTDSKERRIVLRKILQNAGFAGYFEGINPFTSTDEELHRKTADLPLLCIRPVGIWNGASDPGGWFWMWIPIFIILIILIVIALCR